MFSQSQISFHPPQKSKVSEQTRGMVCQEVNYAGPLWSFAHLLLPITTGDNKGK